MSETHEHLEKAEHAAHGADPFTIRVAMTMAIIAAILAAVSLIGHRKHNDALQSQGNANRFYTEAARRYFEQHGRGAVADSKGLIRLPQGVFDRAGRIVTFFG